MFPSMFDNLYISNASEHLFFSPLAMSRMSSNFYSPMKPSKFKFELSFPSSSARHTLRVNLQHVLKMIFHFFNKVTTLGELIQLSERSNNIMNDSDFDLRETAFTGESSRSMSSAPQKTLTRQISSDPKLEKKVTFARLLGKISAEINIGADFDVSFCKLRKVFSDYNAAFSAFL